MESHDGVMICFYPTPEMALALHAALPVYAEMLEPAEFHMTLVYLGDIPDLESQGITQEKVLGVLNSLQGVLSPVEGQISGLGRFTNTHMEDQDAIVLLVDSPQLPDFRMVLTNELTSQGIPYAQNHGFTPHITIMYLPTDGMANFRPPVADIQFNKVSLNWGDVRTDIELKVDTAPANTEETTPMVSEVPPMESAGVGEMSPGEQYMLEKTGVQGGNVSLTARQRVFRLFAPKPKEDEFTVGFKALGNGRWMAVFTNNFEDKQAQILAEKAHDRYIARLDAGLVPMPVLRHWHIPGSEHGKAEWIARAGHMVIAIGRFDDTPQGRAAEKGYQRKGAKYAVSHKFIYPVWAEKAGVIYDYNAYEISTAPQGAEVNQYTGFTTIQEDTMPITKEKEKSLREIFGNNEEAVQAAMKSIEAIEKQGDKLAEFAVRFKTFADVTPEVTETPQSAIAPDLLLTLLEGQKTLSDGWDGFEKVLEGMKTFVESKVAELEKAKTAFEVKTKELDLFLSEKPRRIEDAETVTDEKALEAIAQQSAGVQFDPRYPGMNVPLTNGNK